MPENIPYAWSLGTYLFISRKKLLSPNLRTFLATILPYAYHSVCTFVHRARGGGGILNRRFFFTLPPTVISLKNIRQNFTHSFQVNMNNSQAPRISCTKCVKLWNVLYSCELKKERIKYSCGIFICEMIYYNLSTCLHKKLMLRSSHNNV